ncbi:Adenylate isopentenyltransferase [Melia azedarach]|uniref:Adenylate isopentenyltransferase n=1 Tax=Melia azedarach TaxID=155640 RepID=A0ACC1XF24_MELAZ|nr:Adenylate isopentenyltransferase [Melia azedarach]
MRLVFSPPTTTSYQHYSSFLPPLLPLNRRPTRWRTLMASTPTVAAPNKDNNNSKIVVIMGATGTGKSRLSIDLATRFFPSEIINTDKMQVYKGLDITTNKITLHERKSIRHHFLGEFDPEDGELTPSEFRHLADETISDIVSREKTPFLVGGSNSFIYSLLVEEYDPELNVFDGFHSDSVSSNLRYNCCFLWVDASLPVLFDYLNKRVDEMLESGMFEELVEFFNSEKMRNNSLSRAGLLKAIGVPEFEKYFKMYPPGKVKGGGWRDWDRVRRAVYEEAVREIKENTCQLAKRQIGKILKLRDGGWDLRRLDATTTFKMLMKGEDGGDWRRVWEKQVLEPSVKIVKRFLDE